MLAIVENDEYRSIADEVRYCRLHRTAGLFADLECRREDVPDQRWIRKRRQIDQPDAIRKFANNSSSYLQGDARLTASTGPRDRQQPDLTQTLTNLRQIILSADEPGRLQRDVVLQGAANRLRAGCGAHAPARRGPCSLLELSFVLTRQLQCAAKPLGRLSIWSG